MGNYFLISPVVFRSFFISFQSFMQKKNWPWPKPLAAMFFNRSIEFENLGNKSPKDH